MKARLERQSVLRQAALRPQKTDPSSERWGEAWACHGVTLPQARKFVYTLYVALDRASAAACETRASVGPSGGSSPPSESESESKLGERLRAHERLRGRPRLTSFAAP